MKKNVLLLLLSCLALSSCDLNFDFFKGGNQNSNESNHNNENEKTPENPEENAENPEENQEKEEETNPPKPEVPPNDFYTVTIDFCGSEFSAITSGDAGYDFDDEKNSQHVDDLKEYCVSKLDATNLIKGIECTNLNTALFEDVLYLSVGTGYHGNGKFKEGIFKWNANLPVHKVEIKAKAYSKLGGGGSTDTESEVWIDEESLSLKCSSNVEPAAKTLSKEYDDGTESFTIKSTGSRVFLESVTLSWNYLYEAK